MTSRTLFLAGLVLAINFTLRAQPSFEAPPAAPTVIERADQRRAAYLARVDEVLAWRCSRVKPGELITDLAGISAKLARGEDADLCSRSVIELMKTPGSGPFWMFPVVGVAYLGRDQLSPEARQSIREAWRRGMQMRGDTENHWVMYYTSLYLMAELYPDEPADSWYTGKSSAENLAEARGYLLDWMNLATTIGQGEFNPTHYIGEYAIPLLYLATWAEDPAMRLRGQMKLDWILADLAANTLNGVLHGANARTDDTSVIERWNALASFFSWLAFGNTPPPAGYGGWGVYFATVARHYEVPEVIYRIAVDREGDYVQRDLKRTRRRWRNSDVLMAPIYRTNYTRRDYAVGSYQGGMADPIQTHVWDVTWAVPDPRGVHNTMFSMHPVSSSYDMQTYFTELPDQMIKGVTKEGKASYDSPDKFLGGSRFEQVFQDLDTVIALYNIPPGERFPHINGFFSKDLVHLTVDASGWIFAQGGRAYLAYRPLAGYELQPLARIKSSWTGERADTGDKRLYSPHLKNGTIVQAASVDEFADFAAFQAAIRALPLEYQLEPVPTVKFTTLRGKEVVCTFGAAPVVNGQPVDYTKWKLFEGPYLNAEKGSRRLTLTHGRLERILDFNSLSITERVHER
ncbi:hypothetical protein [Opitutus terrae]|uniref:Heparinase II/III family protein n=1 Tax=Opitutus terrae (strain DSM 11246 / JCM 15787 / PB90-1) TaxID=452637 RepID=B1ZY38_OPITP|nr:hypothetical protein [Opitutus terrae]ACB76187.1 hypothetical protein Oter_2906 [Opitutus terrae PB90-1]